jgi:hypothetical protein
MEFNVSIKAVIAKLKERDRSGTPVVFKKRELVSVVPLPLSPYLRDLTVTEREGTTENALSIPVADERRCDSDVVLTGNVAQTIDQTTRKE